MKIYSMTATFGKLEHATLTLQPGLNIIEAPNEWGKSTWCAFLVNMLYGIDTGARSTKTALADKERYAPWSGSPMAGRIDLNWNGRDITIERSTKGRVVFGNFRAYETETGIDIPELNGTNCGSMLLGVERSVFTRAGFIRLTDLPVTQDDALRRRLNNLVTTGDESGAGDKLQKQLKDLKNKCRYNQSGLLPQAESERDQLLHQLDELYALEKQTQTIRSRQDTLSEHIRLLENHKDALNYAAAQADAQQVTIAENALSDAKDALAKQIEACQRLPERERLQKDLRTAQALQEEWISLQMQPTPQPPEKPELPTVYQDLTPEAIRKAAQDDYDRQLQLEKRRKGQNRLLLTVSILLLVLLAGSTAVSLALPDFNKLWLLIAGAAGLAILLGLLIWCVVRTAKFRRQMDALYDRHPGLSPDRWVADGNSHSDTLTQYHHDFAEYQQALAEAQAEQQSLNDRIHALTGGSSLQECQSQWNQCISAWNALEDARRDLVRQQSHVQALRSMVKTLQPPQFPDELSCSLSETDARLVNARFEQKQLQLQLGQCQGKIETLGQESQLKARLDTLKRRIGRLEDTYRALEMAQEALREATTSLQRRFAPRISKRAQALFEKLTGGRYQRIALGEDLSLSASAEDEDTIRSAQWRSDGTVDQLYLALRLAVAEELTPEAPLVLDDALVRFDDQRLATALEILKESATDKQIVLFTCQGRENRIE